MAEETALQASPPLTKSIGGGDKRRSVQSPRFSASKGKGHEFCKNGKNDEHVGQGKESRPWRKPVAQNAGVAKSKPLGDRTIESPTNEKGKQEVVTTCDLVDVHTEQSSSDTTMLAVTGESKTSQDIAADTSLPSDESVKIEIPVVSETEKVTAEETSQDIKDVDLFKKSCSLSKVKPTLLKLPSLISAGSVARTIDGRKSVERSKSINGKKVLEGRTSFDGRKVVEGRKSIDGKKRSDESKSVNPEITEKPNGNASSVENNTEGSKSADEMEIIQGSKSSAAKKGFQRSKSLNLITSIKDSSLVNANNNGRSETLKKLVAAPKPKSLSMRPSRSPNPVAVKPSSLLRLSSKTSDEDHAGKQISSSKLDAKKVSKPSAVSPSSSSPPVNGEESSDNKKVRIVRALSSVRRPSRITKVAAKELNDQGIQEETVDGIKLAPEKKSLASTKTKMARNESSPSPAPSVNKSTIRSRISYLPSRNKKSQGETEQKITAKDASTSGLRNGKAADLESENQRPSKTKVSSTTVVAQTAHRRSYLKKDSPASNLHKNSSDKFLSARPGVGRKKVQVLSNKVIEETANRLIRTRKSKVLALIGAFETVISIQKKSSARTKKRIPASKTSR